MNKQKLKKQTSKNVYICIFKEESHIKSSFIFITAEKQQIIDIKRHHISVGLPTERIKYTLNSQGEIGHLSSTFLYAVYAPPLLGISFLTSVKYFSFRLFSQSDIP